jgi:hypothetical protein
MTRVIRPEALYQKKKNHEAQFSINQILKDKIEKQINYTK